MLLYNMNKKIISLRQYYENEEEYDKPNYIINLFIFFTALPNSTTPILPPPPPSLPLGQEGGGEDGRLG